VLTQQHQRYTVAHGFVTPPELTHAGVADRYRAALETAAEAFAAIDADLPEAAQYVVPLAYRVRWRVTLNLREAYHLIELRSARQGHPSYRAVAQEMYRHIQAVHPALAAGMRYVDLSDYDLERLAAEQRIDERMRRMP
jgi:thymidylate synthase ThyX